MVELVLMDLGQAAAALTTAYWICLIVGGGLLVISSVAGGDADVDTGVDVDVDVDVDLDVDGDLSVDSEAAQASAGALTSWFSMQFVVFFMAVFGLLGVVMTHLTSQTSLVTAIVAVAGGVVVGQSVHQVLRTIRRSSGDSTPAAKDYVDKPARVTIAVTASRKGEIALRVGRAERFVPAVSSRAEATFSPGDRVAVVAYQNGVAEVVSRQEYEFVQDKAFDHHEKGGTES